MMLVCSLFLWILAFLAHGLLQPKMCRVLVLPHIPGLVLHPLRALLPLLALYLCCRQDALAGIMAWLGTGSVAGLCACLILTAISLHHMRDKGHANPQATSR